MGKSKKLTSSASISDKNNDEYVPLTLSKKIFFSFGHFSNDLFATLWISYVLIYFTSVSQITSLHAGFLFLLGQGINGVSTLAIGYESDRISGFCGYTKRNSWHLFGTVLTTFSFMFPFLPVLGGGHTSNVAKVIYYSPFVMIFTIGWAFVQNSHLTLVSELTPNEKERVSLNGFRHAMTLLANVLVYCLVWFVFNKTTDCQWSPNDAFGFGIIAFSIVCFGSVTSVLYHVYTKEQGYQFHLKQQNLQPDEKMFWFDWFKEIQFYLIGIAFICANLIVIIPQGYLPFYVIYTLRLSKRYSAIVTLVVVLCGFFTSLSMERIISVFGKKPTLLVGSLAMAASILWIYIINESNSMQIFGPAIIIGCGSTILFINTLSMISDMIGSNTNSSAFVFGVLSFVEKLSSGAAFMIIQAIQPQCQNECVARGNFYKTAMTWVLLACTLVCFFIFFALIPFTLGDLRKFNKSTELSKKELNSATTSFIE